MVADLLIADLLRIAREDLDGARLLAAGNNRSAAYLSIVRAANIAVPTSPRELSARTMGRTNQPQAGVAFFFARGAAGKNASA